MDNQAVADWVRLLHQPMCDTKLDTVCPCNTTMQLKMDGWWCALIIEAGGVSYVTSGAEVREYKQISKQYKGVLVGEWMYGTAWSSHFFPGSIILHDVYFWEGVKYDKAPYSHRKEALHDIVSQLQYVGINCLEILDLNTSDRHHFWDTYVMQKHDGIRYEGLVFKSPDHVWGEPFQRSKGTVTIDYVAMGFVEGGGKNKGSLGAIQGGLYINGVLTSVCSVGGGFTDVTRKQIWLNQHLLKGMVFEARGNDLFPSGSLRHPQFSRWRNEEKKPESCILIKE